MSINNGKTFSKKKKTIAFQLAKYEAIITKSNFILDRWNDVYIGKVKKSVFF